VQVHSSQSARCFAAARIACCSLGLLLPSSPTGRGRSQPHLQPLLETTPRRKRWQTAKEKTLHAQGSFFWYPAATVCGEWDVPARIIYAGNFVVQVHSSQSARCFAVARIACCSLGVRLAYSATGSARLRPISSPCWRQSPGEKGGRQQKKKPCLRRVLSFGIRQLPTLPGRLQPSTIGV
jgi:hypothetical protein